MAEMIGFLEFLSKLDGYPLVNEHSNRISPSSIGNTSSIRVHFPLLYAMLVYRSVWLQEYQVQISRLAKEARLISHMNRSGFCSFAGVSQ